MRKAANAKQLKKSVWQQVPGNKAARALADQAPVVRKDHTDQTKAPNINRTLEGIGAIVEIG